MPLAVQYTVSVPTASPDILTRLSQILASERTSLFKKTDHLTESGNGAFVDRLVYFLHRCSDLGDAGIAEKLLTSFEVVSVDK